jgi:hypothetical protein
MGDAAGLRSGSIPDGDHSSERPMKVARAFLSLFAIFLLHYALQFLTWTLAAGNIASRATPLNHICLVVFHVLATPVGIVAPTFLTEQFFIGMAVNSVLWAAGLYIVLRLLLRAMRKNTET